MTTADQMALKVLLNPGLTKKQQSIKLAALYKRMAGRVECPECGHKGPHDDNNEPGDNFAFCCCNCGTHFEEA